jgi:hypothetical protein
MGKVIVVFIFYVFISALLRLKSKIIVAACRDARVIREIFDTNSEFSVPMPQQLVKTLASKGPIEIPQTSYNIDCVLGSLCYIRLCSI